MLRPVTPLLPTEVNVLRTWPLRVGHILAEGFQNLLFHLCQRVRVHGPHAQRVHAAALEGHVQVLRERGGNSQQALPIPTLAPGRATTCPGRQSQD